MAATLITYADGVVTPFLDGIMQELYTSGGGLITGGTITISGASTLHITQAHGALCGREFSIDDGDYSVQLSSSGTKLGRIYLHMDLSNTANPLEVLIETGSSLTPVQQDADVNETNGVYEINLATFDVDESTISNLVSVAPTIKTLAERTLQTITDCVNSTDPQDIAGAAAVSMLNSNLPDLKVYQLAANLSGHQGNGNFKITNLPQYTVPVAIAPWTATDCNMTLFYSSTAHEWFIHCSAFANGDAVTTASLTTVYIYYVKYNVPS